jgi:hypothetical protein
MAEIQFPLNPANNDVYSVNGRYWRWDGVSWNSIIDTNYGNFLYNNDGVISTSNTLSVANSLVNVSGGLVVTGPTSSNGLVSILSGIKIDGQTSSKVTAVSANTIDLNEGNYFTKTITANTTFVFSNPHPSRAVGFVLTLTNGGSANVSWPTGTKWPGGTPPTLTAAGVDMLSFISDDGGTIWRGVVSMLDSK